MDWINFNDNRPVDGQTIWGMQPIGSTVKGTYSYFSDHHRIYIESGNCYLKIVKWATEDVIF